MDPDILNQELENFENIGLGKAARAIASTYIDKLEIEDGEVIGLPKDRMAYYAGTLPDGRTFVVHKFIDFDGSDQFDEDIELPPEITDPEVQMKLRRLTFDGGNREGYGLSIGEESNLQPVSIKHSDHMRNGGTFFVITEKEGSLKFLSLIHI